MQYFGGVSKCFCELISNLPEDVQTKIAIKQSNNVHLKEYGLVDNLAPATFDELKFSKLLPIPGRHKLYTALNAIGLCRGAEYYNRKVSIEALKSQNFDVFHPTFFESYFLKYIGNKPWVITVHDMMPELFPQYYRRRDRQILFKKKHLKEASAIVAVSETTKKDIVRLLGISPDKIDVIYHGGPEPENINEKPLIKEPYFLYVGVRDAYKNFEQTVIDFSEFHKGHRETKLVCTGKGFTKEEIESFKKNGIENAIIHIKATDSQLKNLYANAIAFIYPSLYEGFGMPILEAYAYGCPVMLNDIEVFHEVAGNAAVFFKSKNGNSDLTQKMENLYNLPAESKQKMVADGYERLSKFSWKKSALQLADLYKSLIF